MALNWKRPHKVLEDPAFIQFSASIIDDGSDYPDSEKRYKYGWYSPEGDLRIAASPDGLKWKPLTSRVVLEFNHDIVGIYRHSIRNRYMALHSSYSEVADWEGRRRIVMESVSPGRLRWQRSWCIIEPDNKDEKTEFYGLSGIIARGDLLIGMLKVLRDDLVTESAPENAYGIGYTVLAWSRDGIHWERDREAFLPRNPAPGTWDHAMAWGDCQLIVGKDVYIIYYGGYKWGHKYERFTQRQIGLARIPIDRYISREAGEEKSILRTKKAVMDGRLITVNADVAGELKVRILDSSGKTVRGFDYSDFSPIRGDSLAHVLEWKGGNIPLRKEPLQL